MPAKRINTLASLTTELHLNFQDTRNCLINPKLTNIKAHKKEFLSMLTNMGIESEEYHNIVRKFYKRLGKSSELLDKYNNVLLTNLKLPIPKALLATSYYTGKDYESAYLATNSPLVVVQYIIDCQDVPVKVKYLLQCKRLLRKISSSYYGIRHTPRGDKPYTGISLEFKKLFGNHNFDEMLEHSVTKLRDEGPSKGKYINRLHKITKQLLKIRKEKA